MKNILIAGDSWGCGEWTFENGKLTNSHPGLERFLKFSSSDNLNASNLVNNVTNLSVPSSSCEQILYQLRSASNIEKYDFIIIFVTDYLRPMCNENGIIPFHLVDSKEKLVNLYKKLEFEFIDGLSKINNKNIILLGGLSRINTSFLLNYNNLSSPIPSIIEFLNKNAVQHDIIVTHFLRNLPDDIDYEYFKFIENQNKLWDLVRNDIFFLFDKNHPDRNAHYLIYKKLKKYLKL